MPKQNRKTSDVYQVVSVPQDPKENFDDFWRDIQVAFKKDLCLANKCFDPSSQLNAQPSAIENKKDCLLQLFDNLTNSATAYLLEIDRRNSKVSLSNKKTTQEKTGVYNKTIKNNLNVIRFINDKIKASVNTHFQSLEEMDASLAVSAKDYAAAKALVDAAAEDLKQAKALVAVSIEDRDEADFLVEFAVENAVKALTEAKISAAAKAEALAKAKASLDICTESFRKAKASVQANRNAERVFYRAMQDSAQAFLDTIEVFTMTADPKMQETNKVNALQQYTNKYREKITAVSTVAADKIFKKVDRFSNNVFNPSKARPKLRTAYAVIALAAIGIIAHFLNPLAGLALTIVVAVPALIAYGVFAKKKLENKSLILEQQHFEKIIPVLSLAPAA